MSSWARIRTGLLVIPLAASSSLHWDIANICIWYYKFYELLDKFLLPLRRFIQWVCKLPAVVGSQRSSNNSVKISRQYGLYFFVHSLNRSSTISSWLGLLSTLFELSFILTNTPGTMHSGHKITHPFYLTFEVREGQSYWFLIHHPLFYVQPCITKSEWRLCKRLLFTSFHGFFFMSLEYNSNFLSFLSMSIRGEKQCYMTSAFWFFNPEQAQ